LLTVNPQRIEENSNVKLDTVRQIRLIKILMLYQAFIPILWLPPI